MSQFYICSMGQRSVSYFGLLGLETVSILHLFVWEGEESVSYFGFLCLETVSILHLFVWEGRKSVSYFGFWGLIQSFFFLFPHSFEWLPQKPHLSSTNIPSPAIILYFPNLCFLTITITYIYWKTSRRWILLDIISPLKEIMRLSCQLS